MSNRQTRRGEKAQTSDEAFQGGCASAQNVAGDPNSQPATITRRLGHVLIVVENQPVPFDRRVWSEATALSRAGYEVSVICPKGKNASQSFEIIDQIRIYRHWAPREAHGVAGYFVEYGAALFWEFILSFRILLTRDFDVIQGCNPPDLIFLLGAFYKITCSKRFVFDHHDICPELYEAKFGRKGIFWRLQMLLERWTFHTADVSIATNESFRSIAIERGRMRPERVFAVRTGPNLSRVRPFPADEAWKAGRRFMVAYVGVIGNQDGLELLVDSVAHIRQIRKRDDIQFVIIGDGPELNNIIRLSKDAGVEDFITFVGRVNDDQKLFTILSTADVCVNPDRPNAMNDQSTTIKIMEYMALGKPIVQFDLIEGRNSAREASLYARNDDTADFGDKILELLDDPDTSRKMGAFGQKRVKEVLAWEHEEKKLLAAYQTVFCDLNHAPDAKRRKR
jgi:glycosyltransferase involved in cell wall biosynthesis